MSRRAVAADEEQAAACLQPYGADHNRAMLAAAAAMAGDADAAVDAALSPTLVDAYAPISSMFYPAGGGRRRRCGANFEQKPLERA